MSTKRLHHISLLSEYNLWMMTLCVWRTCTAAH
jgi:hypothetical protein